jgi:hypothetical protein
VDGRVVFSDVMRGDLRSIFRAYINEMQVREAKSPVKISSGSVARRDLIPALKG